MRAVIAGLLAVGMVGTASAGEKPKVVDAAPIIRAIRPDLADIEAKRRLYEQEAAHPVQAFPAVRPPGVPEEGIEGPPRKLIQMMDGERPIYLQAPCFVEDYAFGDHVSGDPAKVKRGLAVYDQMVKDALWVGCTFRKPSI